MRTLCSIRGCQEAAVGRIRADEPGYWIDKVLVRKYACQVHFREIVATLKDSFETLLEKRA